MSETQTITQEAADGIEKLAETFERDQEDLREDYIEYRDQFEEQGASDPTRRALRKLSLDLKGSGMSSRKELKGVVLGAGDPYDTVPKKVEAAKQYIRKQGVDKAVDRGMVKPVTEAPPQLASIEVNDQDYVVIETNSRSPDAGEALPAHDWIMWVYLYALEDGEWNPCDTIINGEDGEQPPVPPSGVPVRFEASVGNQPDDRNTTRLNVGDADPFEVEEDMLQSGEWDQSDLLGILRDHGLGITDLEDVESEQRGGDFGRNDLVVTQGTVTFMELSPDNDSSRRLAITDPFAFGSDKTVTVFLPDHVEVNFAEDSDVYVAGTVSPAQDTQYSDSIDAVGVFVHPDDVVLADEDGFSEPAEDEEEPETAETPDPEPEDEPEPEEADGADGADYYVPEPAVVAEAGYNELRGFASSFDDIPGSGIKEGELRKKLMAKSNELHSSAAEDPEPEEPEAAPEPSDEDDDWDW